MKQTIECSFDAISEDTRDKLKRLCEMNSMDLCVKVGDDYIPVATLTKKPDIPQEIFDKLINQLLNGTHE